MEKESAYGPDYFRSHNIAHGILMGDLYNLQIFVRYPISKLYAQIIWFISIVAAVCGTAKTTLLLSLLL